MTKARKIDKKSDENPPKSARKVPFFILWPELRFWNLISGPPFRPSIQALISGPQFRPSFCALISALISGPHFRPSFQALISVPHLHWKAGLKWGPEIRFQNLNAGQRVKNGTFRWVFITFFVICLLLRPPYACKIPILQKNQSNSFIFDAGALFQKFLTI